MPVVFFVMGCNENRGYIHSRVNHVLDEFEAAHPRHADVEEEARTVYHGGIGEERQYGFVGLHGEAGGLEQSSHRPADGFVVIHDVYERISLCQLNNLKRH